MRTFLIAFCVSSVLYGMRPCAYASGGHQASNLQVGKQPSNLIAFVYRSNLWTVHLDGSNPQQITRSGDVSENSYAWAIGCDTVVIIRKGQVWTASENSHLLVRRTHIRNWQVDSVAFDTAGDRIAFVAEEKSIPYGPEGIYLLDLKSSHLRMVDREQPRLQIPPNTEFPENLAFTSSGKYLLCSYEGEDGGSGRLELLSLATGRRRSIYGDGISKKYYSIDNPALSPGGKWIALTSDSWVVMRPDGYYDSSLSGEGLVIMDADFKILRFLKAECVSSGLAWSPDAKCIIYCSQKGVEMINLKSGVIRRVYSFPSPEFSC